MYVLDNTRLPTAGIPGIRHTTLAGSDNGLAQLSVWRQTIEAGQATPPHRHDCEEVVLVTSGRGELHIGAAVHPFGPDSTLVIPRNADHQIVATETLTLVAALAATPVQVLLPDGQPIELPWRS